MSNEEKRKAHEQLEAALNRIWAPEEEICELNSARFILEHAPYGKCVTGPWLKDLNHLDRIVLEASHQNDDAILELALRAGGRWDARDNRGRSVWSLLST